GFQLTESFSFSGAGLDAVGTKLYALPRESGKLDCFDTAVVDGSGNPTRCAGPWPVQTQSTGRVLGVPSADGVIRSVCADWQCFTLAGEPITVANAGPNTLPAGYLQYHPNHRAGALSSNYPQYAGAARSGPRIAWACDSSWVCCWDMSTDSTCSPAWPKSAYPLYAPTFDPEDDNCIWTNGDDGVIRNYRIDTGEQGCSGGPPKIQFKASVSIPRLGCDETSRVFEYRQFKLLSPTPSQYAGAKLTIKDSNGIKIPGWTNIDIPANQTIDISTLTVRVAGTTPTFDISATGLEDFSIIPRAELKVVSGGPPQVCWCLYPPSDECPQLSGYAVNADPGARDTLVTGDADYSNSLGQSRDYTHREYGTSGSPAQPPIDQCGGSLEGWAHDQNESPVAGVPVALLDQFGNPVMNPITNTAMTTITDSNGYFSLGPVWGGAKYKVQAGQSAYADPITATILSGGNGQTVSEDRLTIISPLATVPRGGTATIGIEMDSWEITVIQQPHGVIECESRARTGGTFTCTAYPEEGYALATVIDNGASGTGRIVGTVYTSLPVGEDHVVTGSFLKDRGNECESNLDCATGFCTDGVCCNSTCGGQCQKCNDASSLGTCAAIITVQGNGVADAVCNGVDDNCNGSTDEGYAPIGTTCGVGVCAGTTGQSTCIGGVEDRVKGTCNPQSNPAYRANELCDALDNNCNGSTDEAGICPALDTVINTKPAPVTASTTATFTYADPITASNIRFECALDGGAWTPCNGTGNGGGTKTYTELANGSHTFLVRAVGANGAVDTTPAFYSWVVDTSIPDTFVLSGPQNPSQSSTANFVFGSNVANPSAWFCAIDVAGAAPTQNQWFACDDTWTWTNLAEGPHKIWVYVVNELGVADTTPATYSWVIDTVPPDTKINGGLSEIVCAKTVTITFGSPDDVAVQAFCCRLDNADFAPCNAGTVTYNNLAEGAHTFQVAAVDVNGNIDPTPATSTFTVDTVAPETTIDLSPANPAQSGEATFVFSSNEAGATFSCKLDGAANFVPCTSPKTYSELADGTHTFQVFAADRGCKVDATPATWTWVIDSTYPETVFTKTPPIRVGQNTNNTFEYEDPTDPTVTTFECQLDGGEWEACDGGTSNLGKLELGTHTFSVRSCAAFGEGQVKCDPTPANYSWEVTPSPCPLDDVAPTITCAPDFVVECVNGGATVDLEEITASAEDDCEPVEVSTSSSDSLPVGVSPIVFEATDGNGNTAFCVTGVTVADTKVPTITCEADKTVQAQPGVCGASTLVTATATDGCDTEGITILGPSGSVDQPVFLAPGENSVSMTAIDKSGNKATCETKVTVTGVDKMEIECAAEMNVDAPADFCGYPEAISADVKDVCAADVNVKSASDSFPIGVTNVTFEASNDRGDTDTCTTKLTVRDVTAPTITCGTVDLQKLPAAFSPQAADACSATLTVSDVGCFQVDGSGTATAVTEGCTVAIRDGVAVAVTSVPVRNGAGAVIPTSEIRVQWKVTAVDPTGNETTLDCSTGIDLSDRDRDRDGVVDSADNCPDTANAGQEDIDQDGLGDVCDESPYDQLAAEGSGGCSGSGVGGGLALAGLLMVMLTRRMRRVQ
ncbi:MAG: hypothetical protein JNJ59_21105, partial [Deltaproteobacteria bacterium]|nr:hypothetical protein [Deltaproteobacteria bacterium]